jgi:hypothetical protein
MEPFNAAPDPSGLASNARIRPRMDVKHADFTARDVCKPSAEAQSIRNTGMEVKLYKRRRILK